MIAAKKKVLKLPMFELSSTAANLWFNISNAVLFFGAVLVAVGTYGAIRTGSIKEHFSDERIAANEAKTADANARAAAAEAQAAVANKAAAEANKAAEEERFKRVKLEQKLAWRSLNDEQRARIAAAIRPFSGQRFVAGVSTDPESMNFLTTVLAILNDAGWVKLPAVGAVTTSDGGGEHRSKIESGPSCFIAPTSRPWKSGSVVRTSTECRGHRSICSDESRAG